MNTNDKERLTENEHALSTPELIGTDEEKVVGIKFWADVIALIRRINTTFISYENKKSVIAAFKKELDLIEIELDNVSSKVSQGGSEIPSADQVPSDQTAEVNVVDLTKNDEVASTIASSIPSVKKPPTFENLEKLRRVAGSGHWDKNYGPIYKDKKKKS